MRGRKNPWPVAPRCVCIAMRAIDACTTELAKAALREEFRRTIKKGRETNQKTQEKCGVKAHKPNGQFEKSAKSCDGV